jgi:predicted nucleic acid-binding protein
MILFDSSIWIDYSIGNSKAEVELLDSCLAGGIQVYICPPILQEVLQGIKEPSDYQSMRDTLFEMNFLQLDPYFVADQAAALYRSLRSKGITIRKPNDCIIASYAIHFKTELAHNDSDFEKIAKHSSLKIYRGK